MRFMDWSSDLDRVQRDSGAAKAPSSTAQQPEWLGSIPQVLDSAMFDVILGSDILYEASSALLCLLDFSEVGKDLLRWCHVLHSVAFVCKACLSWIQPNLIISVRGLTGR